MQFDKKTHGKHKDNLCSKYCLYVRDYKHGDNANLRVIPNIYDVDRLRAYVMSPLQE